MPRFYCPQPLAVGVTVELPEAVAHHLHVVRMQAGAALTLFNGEGGEYAAELLELGKRRATAQVTRFDAREAELPFALTLAQALPEAAKMDWIIEKAMELGAAGIVPLAARRSVVKLAGERVDKRLVHWQGVIVAAAEQCGRNRLASLQPPRAFAAYLEQPTGGRRILLSPRGTQSLASWAREQAPHDLELMIGPEGGFSDDEEQAAIDAGALPLHLGARVLRTETAGLAALAALAACWAA